MAGTSRKPRRKKTPRTRAMDDQFEGRLLNDPRFLRRIENARKGLRAGRGTRLEDVKF